MAARLAMVDWARGFLNQILGDNTASEHAYKRALDVTTTPEYHDHVLAFDTLMHLGLLYHTQGQLPRAEQAYADAIELAIALGDSHRRALLLHHQGRSLAEQGDRAGARQTLATAIEYLEQLRISTRSEEIKIDLLGTVQQVYESTVLEYLACGADTTAFTYIERARVRFSTWSRSAARLITSQSSPPTQRLKNSNPCWTPMRLRWSTSRLA